MKRLLLLVGIVANVFAAESRENLFDEFFKLEDSLLRTAGLSVGCISCDVINKLSQEKRDFIKKDAYIRAVRSFDAYEVLISTVLYNNIARCENPRASLLWPRDFVSESQIRQLEQIKL